MTEMTGTSPKTVTIRVELFGSARMVCGEKHVDIQLRPHASVQNVTQALARKCPELVGKAILDDVSGLLKSYTLNLNGTGFVSDEGLHLKEGDTLLLFSSQAGG